MNSELNPEIRFPRAGKEYNPITHLYITQDIVGYLRRLKARAVGSFHDLLVLMGPQGQAGSVRIIPRCAIEVNPYPYQPFSDVSEAVFRALNHSRVLHPDDRVYGIGTEVGVVEDIPSFLGQYDIYYASMLVSARPGFHVAQAPSRLGFYTRAGNASHFTLIPNIHFMTVHPISPLRSDLFRNP